MCQIVPLKKIIHNENTIKSAASMKNFIETNY